MNILGCLDVLSAGEYFSKGVPVSKRSSHQRALLRRLLLVLCFRVLTLARTTALENVELPLIYRGLESQSASVWRWKLWIRSASSLGRIIP